MLMSASSEFVALCRSQVALLTQALGATFGVVYLTEEFVNAGTLAPKLIPVVVYPETAVVWQDSMALPPQNRDGNTPKRLPKGAGVPKTSKLPSHEDEEVPGQTGPSLLKGTQIVLPLIYEDMMMGLLVTGREDRAWNEQERSDIDRIAQTLAIACILDQRRAWVEQELRSQQHLLHKQRDLLDNLLHQFRNPLTAVRTFGKLLLKRLRPEDVNREVATSIVRESDRLQELLQQFDKVVVTLDSTTPLLPATVEAITPKSVPLLPDADGRGELCWIADILEPLLISANAIALERSLQLQTKIPPDLLPVRANPKALREVLSNLIDNALKYTKPDGTIAIETGLELDHFQGISISDTGPGIPASDRVHLFERHYRGVQAQTEIPGSGLGLAIALELIEQMQGKIQVESPAINLTSQSSDRPGTTFIVWLPLANYQS